MFGGSQVYLTVPTGYTSLVGKSPAPTPADHPEEPARKGLRPCTEPPMPGVESMRLAELTSADYSPYPWGTGAPGEPGSPPCAAEGSWMTSSVSEKVCCS